MKRAYIIHGWSYNLDKWADIVIELKMRDIEPVLLKVPGLTEASDKVWDIEGYISWLDDKLNGDEKPIVIGHSNGGRIALAYAQKHPGRLHQLVLIDSAGVAHNEARSQIKLKILKTLSKVGKVFSLIPPLRKLFYKLIGAQDYYNAPPNMRLTMQNMLKADQQMDFSNVRLPVTIIWGREDSITPIVDGEKLHNWIKGSVFIVIDGAKHAPQATHADKVAEIIASAIKVES